MLAVDLFGGVVWPANRISLGDSSLFLASQPYATEVTTMNLRLKASLIVAVAAAASLAGASAKAQYFGGFGYGGGYGSGMPYNVYGQDSIPYFALYPPVYYSHPVPRPYGFSPFAYPPGVTTPNGGAYYSGTVNSRQTRYRVNPKTTVGKTAAAPVVIENPYFHKEGQVAAQPAGQSSPRPQVVYPLAQFAKQAKLAGTDLDR